MDVPGTTVNASLALYGVQAGSAGNPLVAPPSNTLTGTVENTVSSFLQQVITIPGLAGSAHTFGPLDAEGRHREAWGISVMVLDDSATNRGLTTTTSTALQQSTQTSFDETTVVGLGFAHRVDERWSLGVSAQGFYRSVSRQFQTLEGQNPVTASDGTVTTPSFSLNQAALQLSVVGLFAEAGVKWQATPRLTLGLSLATPSVNLVGNGTFSSATGQATGLAALPATNVSADTELPLHGRLGAALRLGRALLAADVSAWAPTSYDLIGNAAYAAKIEGIPPNLVAQVVRNPVVNFNLGAEGDLPKGFALRGGLFTNFSSAPAIDQGAEPQLDDVNVYGAALGFKIPSPHQTETTVGVVYSYGAGQSKTTVPPTSAVPETISNFEFCIGGSYDFK